MVQVKLGKAVLKAAEINEVDVKCFVDRKESLWDNQIGNINIVSLEKALEDFPNTSIVVGSFEFLEQIEGTIAKALRAKPKNRVFSVKNLIEE